MKSPGAKAIAWARKVEDYQIPCTRVMNDGQRVCSAAWSKHCSSTAPAVPEKAPCAEEAAHLLSKDGRNADQLSGSGLKSVSQQISLTYLQYAHLRFGSLGISPHVGSPSEARR